MIRSDVSWDVVTREEPDADAALDPLHDIDTTSIVVKSLSITVVTIRVSESTASIVAVRGPAVGVGQLAGRWVAWVRLSRASL